MGCTSSGIHCGRRGGASTHVTVDAGTPLREMADGPGMLKMHGVADAMKSTPKKKPQGLGFLYFGYSFLVTLYFLVLRKLWCSGGESNSYGVTTGGF